ncbi:hypothetical protein RDI58_001442 [Solanum bulbocastanum]|uniref:Uncharacterized protein n=1 Tax=Solanum bulbocastanum TaxID=147425 RepID=A0AAN8U9K7_SOLBU
MDDIEEVFMKWNYIDKEPYGICHMIEEAILVAGIKYPHQFDKRKNRIIRMISIPSTFDDDDDKDDDTSTLEEEDCVVGDEDEVTNAEEETQQSQKQITKPLKIRITYSKTVQELDGHKQLKKQSHKGFKKMETDQIQHKRIDSDTEKKTPTQCRKGSTARKQCTSGLTKTMPASLKKMNVATERVQAPPHQQSNCSAITRSIQSSAPMQKEKQSINEIKKFESSKRKFEERLAEQKTAKRRIILVDYHDMPKLANDPPATRRCWNRNRKRF